MVFGLLVEDVPHLGLDGGELVPDGIPDNLNIHSEVAVYKYIPEPGDLPPFDVPVLTSDLFRDVLGGLSYDFQVADDRVQGPFIDPELLGTMHPGRVATDLGRCIQDVLQVDPSPDYS